MTDGDALLALVAGRRGHFALESGHHGALWLDLDPLFASPRAVAPLVAALAERLRPHAPDVVCGPLLGGAFLAQLAAQALGAGFSFAERAPSDVAPPDSDGSGGLYRARYRLPAALAERARGRRVAIVDDVMSAGSSLRATHAALEACGATVVAAGALLVLGDAGERWFAERGVPVVACGREPYALWAPDACPLCAEGVPLERPA